jgi:hypothetical protein
MVLATSARLVKGWQGSPFEARRPVDRTYPPPDRSVLVVGDRAVGAPAPSLGAACVRLAARAGCGILQVGFVAREGGHRVCCVDPVGALAEEEEIDAVSALLAAVALRRCPAGAAR